MESMLNIHKRMDQNDLGKFLLANENCLPLTNLLLLSSLKKLVLLFTNIQCCVLYTYIILLYHVL
jgi:hypothetical protein